MCLELSCGYSFQTLTKIIAYCEITVYVCLIALTALFGVILEGRPDLAKDDVVAVVDFNQSTNLSSVADLSDDSSYQHHLDLMPFLQMSYPLRSFFTFCLVLHFIAGIIFSIVLLQGAQERNLFKVKVWFVVTIISYLLWIPVFAFWVCHAAEPVNVLMSGFMTYMLGGLCLWVVSGFIEELRIESISHRAGYKDVPFYKI